MFMALPFSQFCSDFELIVTNCEAYNGTESRYTEQAKELKTEFYQLIKIYFTNDVNISPYGMVMDHQNTMTKAEEQMAVLTTNPSLAKDPAALLAHHNKAKAGRESSDVHIEMSTTVAADSDTADGMSVESEDELPSFRDILSSSLR